MMQQWHSRRCLVGYRQCRQILARGDSSGVNTGSMYSGDDIALLYLLIAKRQPFYADVSGESIAVDNVSH